MSRLESKWRSFGRCFFGPWIRGNQNTAASSFATTLCFSVLHHIYLFVVYTGTCNMSAYWFWIYCINHKYQYSILMYIYIYMLYIHTVWVCLKTPISHMWFVIDCVYHKTYLRPLGPPAIEHLTFDLLTFRGAPWQKEKPSPGSVWLVGWIWVWLVGFGWRFPNQPTCFEAVNLKPWWTGLWSLRPGNLWRSHWERNFVETVQSCKAEYLQGHFEDVTLRLTSTHWIYMHKMVSMICSPEVTCCNVGLSNADGSRSHSRTSPANSQSKTSIHPPQFNR